MAKKLEAREVAISRITIHILDDSLTPFKSRIRLMVQRQETYADDANLTKVVSQNEKTYVMADLSPSSQTSVLQLVNNFLNEGQLDLNFVP